MRVSNRAFLAAIAMGATTAYLSLAAFGYWVAFHPFGRVAERSEWLVPALQILSWLPFVAAGSLVLIKASSSYSRRLVIAAAVSASFTAAAHAVYHATRYASGLDFLDVVSSTWLDLLSPLALFPVFVSVLANRSKRTLQRGAL